MRTSPVLLLVLLFTLPTTIAPAQTDRLTNRLHALQEALTLPVTDWNPNTFPARSTDTVAAAVTAAQQKLETLAPLVRQYQIYYVGHAHIDMNWLWTWPETIDACHRTWDSAMKLMDQFPDFSFVQSQPGAYVPIQQQFPAEFARMQQVNRRGQWETVGGLWDESDTNMPSGEALACSLFLGQRYFKQQFGHYAVTGWLPDSFGHSWQLPQLFAGVGIDSFYHERSGDGLLFACWQSPDGSRVLKANTDQYNAEIEPGQLTEPWDNEQRYQIKKSLVVFGVGDHGGGPPREQILKGKAFQADPLLPQVHFLTAEAFFQQLRSDPHVDTLPIVDTDLQYVAMGCYTTHADIKAAVRDSENALYAAEVFASLAAMQGRPYPVTGFSEAWKPTAFAQFHDIMCGSAIHATYDWMKQRLAPARQFVAAQLDRALAALAAATDTQGGKAEEPAIVVWNARSFTRDDIVRVHVPDARRFHSVYDAAGHRFPVQAKDDQTIAFVAQQAPGFGHITYFLSTEPAQPAPAGFGVSGDGYRLSNPYVSFTIARDTGAITELTPAFSKRNLFAPGQPGNVLQVLGDSGNAWDIRFTGEQRALTTQGAQVTVLDTGPVNTTVRVQHAYRHSTFVQDITLYNTLPRIDVPTTVSWHEHGQMLKVAFPLDMDDPVCRVGIPYGSIERPHNGQENPGQKWMDVTAEEPGRLLAATPLDLSALFNHNSGLDFDGEGRGFPRNEFPEPGVHPMGRQQVPIRMAEGAATMPDNIACASQVLTIPATATGNTLFLVGASAPNAQDAVLYFVQPGDRRTARHVHLNDWIVKDLQSNEMVATFPYQFTDRGHNRNAGAQPHL